MSKSPPAETGSTRKAKTKALTRLWSSASASISRMEDQQTNSQYLVRKVAASSLPDGVDQQQATTRILAIGKQNFPGVLNVVSAKASSKDVGVVLKVENDSRTLAEVINSQSAGRSVLASLKDLAGHLDELHSRSLVHGDLHPDSIIVAEGTSSVLDFATGHVFHAWTANDRRISEHALGKVVPRVYVAPEIQRGLDAGPASDQYAFALGCLECLCSRRLQDSESLSKILPGLSRKFSDDVAATFQRALSTSPDERYADCRSFFSELATAVDNSQPHQRRRRWWIAAALLPLFLIPAGKWIYAKGHAFRLSQQESQLKQIALEKALLPYQVAPTPPRTTARDSRLPPESDLASSSVVNEWRTASVVTQQEASMRKVVDSFDGIISQLKSDLRVSSSFQKQATGAEVVAFTKSLGLLATGDPTSQLMIKFNGFPTPPENLTKVPMKLTVTPKSGRPVEHQWDLKNPSSFSSPISLSPTTGSWSESDSISFRVLVQRPVSEEWIPINSTGLADIQFGTVEWLQHDTIKIDTTTAVTHKNSIPSGITLESGMKYKVKATGLIAPWKSSFHSQLQSSGTRGFGFEGSIGIPPEGVSVGSTRARTRSYHAANASTGNQNWGALMMKIGAAGSSKIPATQQMPQRSSSFGEIYFGLNLPSQLRAGGRVTDLIGEEEYWGNKGAFEVTVETLEIKFPTSTPASVRSVVHEKY